MDARSKRIYAYPGSNHVEEELVSAEESILSLFGKRAEGALEEFKDWFRFVWDGDGVRVAETRTSTSHEDLEFEKEGSKRDGCFTGDGIRSRSKIHFARSLDVALEELTAVECKEKNHVDRSFVISQEALFLAQEMTQDLEKSITCNANLEEEHRMVCKELHDTREARQAEASILRACQEEAKSLRESLERKTKELKEKSEKLKEASDAMIEAELQNGWLTSRLEEEVCQRRSLQEMVFALQGNIRVLCRVRPLLNYEEEKCISVRSMNGEVEVASSLADTRPQNSKFEFSHAFDERASQEEVYRAVAPLVGAFCDGADACVFAYGQTGSGKTHTMEGEWSTKDQCGVFVRAFNDIFMRVAGRKIGGIASHGIKVSMLEVYNDTIRDLLALPSADLLEVKFAGTRVRVPGVVERQVTSVEEAMQVLEEGRSRRATASTSMNRDSSRSHVILSVRMNDKEEHVLHLVDLAGSERVLRSGVEGRQLYEARHINRSLSALGDVISALQRKERHIPYRNSKLTSLLQDGLRSGSKVMLLLCLAPEAGSAKESLSALTFAQRAQIVTLGTHECKKKCSENV